MYIAHIQTGRKMHSIRQFRAEGVVLAAFSHSNQQQTHNQTQNKCSQQMRVIQHTLFLLIYYTTMISWDAYIYEPRAET